MCFSAPVSFAASVVLAATGGFLAARIRSKRYLPLALIPLLFAIQQAAEGFVWLSLPERSKAQDIFLFFAYVIWPLWIPFSLLMVEKSGKRRQLLGCCLALGGVIGTLLALDIPSLHASVDGANIYYLQHFRFTLLNSAKIGLYVLATILPFFISSLKKIWVAGVLLIASLLLTYLISALCVISVWCFFAALFSLALFFIIKVNHGR